MPRMKAPKGYYTLTEAAKILNLSNAMVRNYVKKGKIHYLLPEGREQGFYLKRDVDNLANEINAFLSMDEFEEESSEFKAASEEELLEIVKIANALFSSEKNDNPTVPDWRYKVLKKNPETQFALKVGDKIIGFATILPFKTDTDKIEKLLVSERVGDAKVTDKDIESFDPGKHIHLYIAGIGIDESIEKVKRRYYGAKLVSSLIDKIVDLGDRGIIIENITALGATHIGIRLLQTFGLHEIPSRAPKKRAFTMNIQESGSPLSMQYKKALKEQRGTK